MTTAGNANVDPTKSPNDCLRVVASNDNDDVVVGADVIALVVVVVVNPEYRSSHKCSWRRYFVGE